MPRSVPSISVVVPCYNVEPYLRQCLDSIAGQTFGDFEVLCVNDGSTDATLAILAEYGAMDSRFAIIDKENAGYGAAVNAALDQAQGTWVSIVEPDDILAHRAFEHLMGAQQAEGGQADIVKGSFRDFFDDIPHFPRFGVPPLETRMPKVVRSFSVADYPEVLFHHPSIWSCLYRRSFLEAKSIRMVEAPGSGWTDNPWFLETFLQAGVCVWVPEVCYHYRQQEAADSRRVADPAIPFDRLHEMREIIDRTGFKGHPDIEAAHAKRVFAYIDLVIDKWGFSEIDPHVRAMINRAVSCVDPAAVASSKRLPASARIYYRDVKGAMLAEHPAVAQVPEDPKLSIFLLTSNDRRLLWQTIRSLARQSMRSFEVICVDDASRDRTAEILRAVAAKDRRFTLIEAKGDAALAAGIARARAPWTLAIRPGQTLTSVGWLRRLVRECERHRDAEILTIRADSHARIAGALASGYIMRRTILESPAVPRRFFADDGVGIVLGGLRVSRRTEHVDLACINTLARWRVLAWRTESTEQAVAQIRARCDALAADASGALSDVLAARALASEIRDGFRACGRPLRREEYFRQLEALADREEALLRSACALDAGTERILGEIDSIRARGYSAWAAERAERRELASPSTPGYFHPMRVLKRARNLLRK